MRISIIIPVYNIQNYIKQTIESILNQNHKGNIDYEVIIVNDGSTDESLKQINLALANNHASHVKVISQKNQGVSVARNVGIDNSCGEYLVFLDGDDYVSHDIIKSINDVICKDSPDILYWSYDMVDDNKNTVKEYQFRNSSIITDSGLNVLSTVIEKKTSIWMGSATYKRNLIESNNVRFTPNCVSGEDIEFIYKALIHADKVIKIDNTLSYYLQRKGSITNQYNVRRFDAILAKDRVCKYIDGLKDFPLDILDILRAYLPSHYMSVYKSCMRELLSEPNYNQSKALSKLNSDIKNNYPEMNRILTDYLSYMKYFGIKKRIKIYLTILYPRLYFRLFSIWEIKNKNDVEAVSDPSDL